MYNHAPMSKTRRPEQSNENESTSKPSTVRVPLSMTSDLDKEIDDAAATVGLSKQATMRAALKRGLKILVTQMTTPPSAA